ncbi:general stress protein [Spongiactinospora gelatinilytica]|uniref:general stress protein n=1 Tax=Spongiactinospora gelatinilytica TaxID=2666298 RepID=UPI0018F6EFAF|nr:general stress protein [Spongiactinospora gelatinilytica]
MTAPSVGRDTVAVDRRLLVSYENYASAQRTVDALSDAGFPVEHVSIVGSDLRLEEIVTGRVTNPKAALAGAGSGVLFGAIVGLFLGLFTTTTGSFIALVLWAALWGAVLGAAFGFVNHAFQRGKRDFSSRNAIVAGRYDVMVDAEHLERARAMTPPSFPGYPGASDHTGRGDTVAMETPPTAGTFGPGGTGVQEGGPVPPPRTEGPQGTDRPVGDPPRFRHPDDEGTTEIGQEEQPQRRQW